MDRLLSFIFTFVIFPDVALTVSWEETLFLFLFSALSLFSAFNIQLTFPLFLAGKCLCSLAMLNLNFNHEK